MMAHIMKDNLTGDLAYNWGGHGGLRDVLVHVGSDCWDSGVPWPLPGWRSVVLYLVEEIISGAASCK